MARLQAWCNIQNYIIMSQRNQPNCKWNVPVKSPGFVYNYDPATETPIYDIYNFQKYTNKVEIKYKNTINCKVINVCSN